MKTSQITCTSMILTDLCFTKQRIKIRNTFCQSCLQCFSSTNILTEHKEVCLGINGAQSGRLEKGTIVFQTNTSSIKSSGADPERICEFSKFQCEKMSATMVGRQRKFLILDELKQS